MLAAIGCIVPEALASNGVAIGEPRWWVAGTSCNFIYREFGCAPYRP